MEEWISLREFARRREVTLGAVQKAIESKRVTAVRRSQAGRLTAIEFHQACLQWNRNTDPDQAGRAGQGLAASNTQPTGLSAASVAPGSEDSAAGSANGELPLGKPPAAAQDNDEFGYLGHRAKREEFQAKRAELDYHERVGTLVSAADIREQQFTILREIRDNILAIATRVSPRLAAETDPMRIQVMLDDEHRKALNELSRALAIDVAGGAAGRAHADP